MIEVSSVKLHTMIEVSLSRFIQFITVVPVEELRWNDSSQRPGPGNYRRQNLRTYRSRELPSYLSCFNASPKSFYLFRTNIRKYFLFSDVQAMLDVRPKKLLRKIALIVRNSTFVFVIMFLTYLQFRIHAWYMSLEIRIPRLSVPIGHREPDRFHPENCAMLTSHHHWPT
jgi:hypothetical protein